MTEKIDNNSALKSFMIYSKIELDDDLKSKLSKVSLSAGYNSYEKIGMALGLINQLTKELQELRNSVKNE